MTSKPSALSIRTVPPWPNQSARSPGRDVPRRGWHPAGAGMLNGIGIQNPGIDHWLEESGPRLAKLTVPVWGSAVGLHMEAFARVAAGLEAAGVAAVEINLSCPNLEDGSMFALEAKASARVVRAVRDATGLPVGAKLSPNAVDIVAIAEAGCRRRGGFRCAFEHCVGCSD